MLKYFKDTFLLSSQFVTAENVSSYTIWDVVLPLPGNSIKYPKNEQADWYVELAKADGFDNLECFNCNNRAFAMRGTYRKVYCLPGDFEFEVRVECADGSLEVASD